MVSIILLLIIPCNAQDNSNKYSFDIHITPSISMSMPGWDETQFDQTETFYFKAKSYSILGLSTGASIRRKIGGKIGVESGINYTRRGYEDQRKIHAINYDRDDVWNYYYHNIDIPILIRYNFYKWNETIIYSKLGPVPKYYIGQTISIDPMNDDKRVIFLNNKRGFYGQEMHYRKINLSLQLSLGTSFDINPYNELFIDCIIDYLIVTPYVGSPGILSLGIKTGISFQR